jgi:chorismate--pyruvate lyase
MKSHHRSSPWYRRLAETAGGYRPWLLDRASLTQRIQSRCRAFSVRHVSQRRGKVASTEDAPVGMRRGARALLRDVYLYCGETPVVFAHSVMPEKSLRGSWQALGRLGDKPLGAELFSNPRVRRTPLRFKKLHRHHELYRAASRMLPDPPAHLWARRSLFFLHRRPILVTEVFLPGILELQP